jgi:hypothetical protein
MLSEALKDSLEDPLNLGDVPSGLQGGLAHPGMLGLPAAAGASGASSSGVGGAGTSMMDM